MLRPCTGSRSCLAFSLSARVVEGPAGAGRSGAAADQPNFSYNARPVAWESLGYHGRAAVLPTS